MLKAFVQFLLAIFGKSARKDDMDEVDEIAKGKSARKDGMEDMNEIAKRETPRKDDMNGVVDPNDLDVTGDVKMAVWYLYLRVKFRRNSKAMEELDAWIDKKADYNYTVINGLIPSRIVENPPDFENRFVKSDTWFSEFEKHNPTDLILSDSSKSYIIGNIASYDKRQYQEWFLHPDDPTKIPDPNVPSNERKRSADARSSAKQATSASESKGSNNTTANRKITPEGQAFGHCLVIPRTRIFNIVDPKATEERCAVIVELYTHFITFWNGKKGPEKLLKRTRDGFDEQKTKFNDRLSEAALISSPSSQSMTRQKTRELAAKKEAHRAELERRMGELEAGYDDMAAQFLKLRAPEDFVFGIHPFPHNSVGHLHLHVYPRKAGLRKWSSWEHDWKTVEFETVLEAEGETLEAVMNSWRNGELKV